MASTDLRAAAQQALEALTPFVRGSWTPGLAAQAAAAMACLESALAEPPVDDPHGDHWVAIAEAAQKIAASKECGPAEAKALCAALDRLTEAALAEPEPPPEAQTEAEKMAYCAGWWDALDKARKAEPVQEPDSPERRCGGPGCDMTCCQPVQEPVAWSHINGTSDTKWHPPQHPAQPQGCDHCNHPLYAATKCRVCGRATEEMQGPVGQMGAMFRTHPAVELQRSVESAVRPACGVDPAAKAETRPRPTEPVEPVALVANGVLVKSELPRGYTGYLYTAPPQRTAEPVQEPEFWGRVAARQASRITQLEATGQQALEALEKYQRMMLVEAGCQSEEGEAAIDNLRSALAEPVEPLQEPDSPERRCGGPGCDMKCCQPAQEPVAWLTPGQDLHLNNGEGFRFSDWTPLYTAQPQRKPLSGIEVERLLEQVIGSLPVARKLVRAVERAHGIKE